MKTIPGSAVLFVFSLLLSLACEAPPTRTGLDQIEAHRNLFAGQRVGIITNHTAYDQQDRHIVDRFLAMENVRVTALFGPEHGIRGEGEAGEEIASGHDPATEVPVYSLYGKTRKPTPEMLSDVDVLIFDIQDVGARFYTYTWTMALAMEAAAEQGRKFVVLDRPNPINGVQMEGTLLEPGYETFVGMYPIPVRHGMTLGELAQMFNGEGWLANGVQADLTVIPLQNWRRQQWYDQTGLTFRKPSPNIPDLEVATVYPGTCLLEGTTVSEGRGTETPFLLFGAPWIDKEELTIRLNKLNLPGLNFLPVAFTPQTIPGMASNPKFENRECYGAELFVTNRDRFEPYWTGIQIVNTIFQMYPDSLQWRQRHFDRLCGTSKIRQAIVSGEDLTQMREAWQQELQRFAERREKYLLYLD